MENKKKGVPVIVVVIIILILLIIGAVIFMISTGNLKLNFGIDANKDSMTENNEQKEYKNNIEEDKNTIEQRVEINESQRKYFNELLNDYMIGTWLKDITNIVLDEETMIEFALLNAYHNYPDELFGSTIEQAYTLEHSDINKIYLKEEVISKEIKKYFNINNIEYSQSLSEWYHPNIKAFETIEGLGGDQGEFKIVKLEKLTDTKFVLYATHIYGSFSEYDDEVLYGEANFYLTKVVENEEERYCFEKVEYTEIK